MRSWTPVASRCTPYGVRHHDGRETALARGAVDVGIDGDAVAQADRLVMVDEDAFGEGRGALGEQHRGDEDQAGEHGCVPPRTVR